MAGTGLVELFVLSSIVSTLKFFAATSIFSAVASVFYIIFATVNDKHSLCILG